MSLPSTNPTRAPRNPPNLSKPKRKPSNQSTTKPAPKQNTMWNFIKPHLPGGYPTGNATEPLLVPTTQDSTLHLTPPMLIQQTPNEQQPPSLFIQSSLDLDTSNDPWGDSDQYHQLNNNFRVLSKNVNTINPQSLDMTAMAIELQNSNASIFMVQETNTTWKPPATLSIHAQCSRVHRHVKLATSSSQDNIEVKHHPGGTLTAALSKWAS